MSDGFRIGSKLYAIYDQQLKGFITWMEKGTSAIFLFTTGEKAEKYINDVSRNRPLVVYLIDKRRARAFIDQMLNAKIEYALIDVPSEHANILEEQDDAVVRNYAIVDLRKAARRMG